jgi:glyoxylase-like metal-dependent hydrolase (beta-lactamase superfamily II)
MNNPSIHTIDLSFLGRSGTIGAYLVPHSGGGILVETGPCSTIQNLLTGLNVLGYGVDNITAVFLTHIHLDHAGAAGWWAQHGARIYVHENGAPHLINPERLLASAGRLYGARMGELWGEFIPVAADRLTILHDGEVTTIGGLDIQALNVPGHASHHLAYIIGDACFSGDIGGIRLNPGKYLRLPMPPPDLNLEQWRNSIRHIQDTHPRRIIPTHYGEYPDAEWHLQAALEALDEVEHWMELVLPQNPPLEDLRRQFSEFEQKQALRYGIPLEIAENQQIANPSFMSADGILRYWNKFRNPPA